MNKPFYFIGNIIDTDLELPIDLIDGCCLKKANEVQIKHIKQRLKFFLFKPYDINPYETKFSEVDAGYNLEYPKNTKDWEYWIIEYDFDVEEYEAKRDYINNRIKIIDESLLLLKQDIKILWGYLYYSDTFISSYSSFDSRSFNFYQESNIVISSSKIDQNDINNIHSTIKRIQEISNNEKNSRILKSLIDLRNIFDISKKSPFRIIGLFSILESLLTIPNDNDRSINKQLQSKLYLLNNRFEEKVDFRHYFKVSPDIHFEKVIEKLYSYRSDIAHGNKIDFEKKLKELNNHIQVEKFLLELVKKCLKQALIEPLLINDLRNC